MKPVVSFGALMLGVALAGSASASDVGYIYGSVETVDGRQYEGELRWGKEEAFWDDIFNATKSRNENLEYLDSQVLDAMRWRQPWKSWGLFVGMPDEDFTHIFATRFGDLARIRVRGDNDLVAEFRNGQMLTLKGGSNDVGAQVTVMDAKQGQQTLDWSRIRRVEFRPAPPKLAMKLGEPLYGTVKTGEYEFTGHIQWDNDECLSIDELNGHTEHRRVAIPFGDIASIRKYRSGAIVTMKSGSEMYVTGTNDVNDENRGIVVKIPELGSVKIGWGDLDEVTFRPAPNTGRGYSEYGAGRELSGVVSARGNRYTGRIVFDLDEEWDFELLQGKNGSTEYLIPFREIARIKPRGLHRSDVVLRSGLTIELEESEDVSRRNEGLLVFADSQKPTYVSWRDVDEIVFR